MGLGEVVIIAGVGCRKGTAREEIEAAILAALANCKVPRTALSLIATTEAKSDEPGVKAAASALRVPFVLVPAGALAEAGRRTMTRSQRVLQRTGVPSVAEAAALAAGGPAARLLAPRISLGRATCALVQARCTAPEPK
jgi:cobalt-precorrin 5A hydrolase